MTEAKTVPDDVRKLAAQTEQACIDLPANTRAQCEAIIARAIMADRATRPTIPLPDTGVSGERLQKFVDQEGFPYDIQQDEVLAMARELRARRSRDPGVEGLVKALERIETVAGKAAHHRGTEFSAAWFGELIEGIVRNALATYREGQK